MIPTEPGKWLVRDAPKLENFVQRGEARKTLFTSNPIERP